MYIAIEAQANYVAWSPVMAEGNLLVSYKAASKLGSEPGAQIVAYGCA